MAGQFQLVSAIIADVRYQADIEGQTDRHPDASLLRLFNASAQQLRTKLATFGFDWVLTEATGTLSTTPPTNETFSELDWPLDAQRIYGIHVLVEAGRWLPLRPITIGGIRDYQGARQYAGLAGYQGTPAAFALKQAPLGVAAVETKGKILIVPLPQSALPYKLFYLPNWTPLTSSHTFNGHAGFTEWVMWDMVVKVAARDNDSNSTFAIAQRERDRIERLIASEAPNTQQAGPEVPRRADGCCDDTFDDWRW